MVKLVVCVKRKPGMAVEEFHDYWRTQHGSLLKGIPGLRRYIRKYVQSHTIPQAYEHDAAPFDGIAELWFDDYAAVEAFLADSDYLAQVRPDELKFSDHPNLVWFVTEEVAIIEG